MRMATDLLTRITAEIKDLQRQVDAQKRIIKKSAGKVRTIEQAEAELKALHTRLAVLEKNRTRLANQEPGLT
jgi:deoxyribose-phosphate aldolase